MSGAEPRLRVGVFADCTATRRTRLLAALELAFPVRFEARRPGELGGLDAVLDRGNGVAAREAAAAGTPALLMLGDEPAEAGVAAASFDLARSPLLDPRLRGASLPDRRLLGGLHAEGAGDRPGPAATVLARWGEHPVWWAEGPLRVALLAPRELGESEALRDRLCEDRALALLPLVEFLRGVTRRGRLDAAPAGRLLHHRRPQPALADLRLHRAARARPPRPRARLPRRPRDRSARHPLGPLRGARGDRRVGRVDLPHRPRQRSRRR